MRVGVGQGSGAETGNDSQKGGERVASGGGANNEARTTASSPKSILDPDFVYVRALDTDIRRLYDRIRAEQKKVDESKVRPFPVKKGIA